MALIKCEECGREISTKANACPGCGAPQGRSSSPEIATTPQSALPERVSIEEILKHVDQGIVPKFARTVNGIGATFAGYVRIPGYSDLGLVKHFACFLFIPLYPLGTYLVKDWDGTGGRFIGKISTEAAERLVSGSRQAAAVVMSTVIKIAVVIFVLFLCSLVFGLIRK